MKIALFQSRPHCGDVEGAFGTVERMLSASAQAGAEMLVFPELFLPGYNQPALHASGSQPQGEAWENELAALARQTGCGLTIGWAERDGEDVFNAASCFDRTGAKLAHYRKVQLFGDMEKKSFTAGNAYKFFQFGDIRAGLLICYDVEFAHHVQALAEQDVKLLLVPTANPAGYENVSELLVPARAAETGMAVVYANYCGIEQALEYGGRSLIAAPDGSILASAGSTECLLVAELDENAFRQSNISRQSLDRRLLNKLSDF